MPRQAPPLKNWLTKELRRIAMRWSGKAIARDRAKIYVPDGKFKNGKPKTKLKYKCAECERQKLETYWEREETQADHISAVIEVSAGFKDWNTYIDRLFCAPEGYEILCKPHHLVKTLSENKQRNLTASKNCARIDEYAKKTKRSHSKSKRNRPSTPVRKGRGSRKTFR